MRPMMSYFGGKWQLARHYLPPQRGTVVEPFAGGAGYSLYHEPKNVILVEKDATICGVWDFMVSASRADILSLPLLGEFETLSDINAPEEARNLVGMWLGVALSGPRQKASPMVMKHHVNGVFGSIWSERTRYRIAEQVARIKHWHIICGDYTDVPDIDAHYFVDPPYQRKGKFYKFHTVNYVELSAWCMNRKGYTVVCENEGADWLPFRHFKEGKSIDDRRGGKATTSEVIWDIEQ